MGYGGMDVLLRMFHFFCFDSGLGSWGLGSYVVARGTFGKRRGVACSGF